MLAIVIISILIVSLTAVAWLLFIRHREFYAAMKRLTHSMGDLPLGQFSESFDMAERLKEAKVELARAMDAADKFALNDPRRLMMNLEQARISCYENDADFAIAIIEKVIVECNPEKALYRNIFARAQLNLAEALAFANQDILAELKFRDAIKFCAKEWGSSSQEIAVVLNRFAEFLASKNRVDEAKVLYKITQTIIDNNSKDRR